MMFHVFSSKRPLMNHYKKNDANVKLSSLALKQAITNPRWSSASQHLGFKSKGTSPYIHIYIHTCICGDREREKHIYMNISIRTQEEANKYIPKYTNASITK